MLLPIGTCIIYDYNKFDWALGYCRLRLPHYIIGYIIGYECRHGVYNAVYVVQDRSNGKINLFYTIDECIDIYYERY
jgi:hypothetical protein